MIKIPGCKIYNLKLIYLLVNLAVPTDQTLSITHIWTAVLININGIIINTLEI